MTTTVNGKAIAAAIEAELAQQVKDYGVQPHIVIFRAEHDAVTEKYVGRKRAVAAAIGAQCTEMPIAVDSTTESLISAIQEAQETADGIVVQLPLPAGIDREAVIAAIPPRCDIDNLSGNAPDFIEAPVAGAVREIMERHDIAVEGKRVVIVGRGRLVGQPVAAYFQKLPVEEVVTLAKDTGEAESNVALQSADIIVSGAGVPGRITPDLVKEGAVVLDAGTSSSAGTVVGDVAPECEEMASLIAKTPGGVGPITIAILFKNLVESACRNQAVGNAD